MAIRFLFSLATSCFRGLSTLAIGILLARYLGIDDYGNLAFLVATSLAVKQLIDFGASSAFFTFLSQKKRKKSFVWKFWVFFFGKYILTIFIVFVALPNSTFDLIWQDNSEKSVILAILAIGLQADFWPTSSQLLESQRSTILSQVIFTITQIAHILLVILLNYIGMLSISSYFLMVSILWCLAGVFAFVKYRVQTDEDEDGIGNVNLKKYIRYCAPIIPVIFMSFCIEFIDKWMLQRYGGAREQAFFSVASQISSVSLVITASFIKIFWKEIAELMHREDDSKAKLFYLNTRNVIYLIGCAIACSMIPVSGELLSALYGTVYSAAALPLTIMAIYSVQQSLGQIDSAFLMASEKTNIGLISNIILFPICIILSILFISDLNFFGYELGLNLGASGLAIKLVITQFISIMVMSYLIQKFYKLRFNYFYQLRVPFIFISIGIAIKFFIVDILVLNGAKTIVCGMVSLVMCLGLSIICPRFFLLKDRWLHLLLQNLKKSEGS